MELSRHNSTQDHNGQRTRRSSVHSRNSGRARVDAFSHRNVEDDDYDVNNPPSMPGSPKLGSLDDLMITELSRSDPERDRDALIDIDDDESDYRFPTSAADGARRRPTVTELAQRDVCFPVDDGLTEIDELEERRSHASSRQARRRRHLRWPDLSILSEWSREEKEERTVQEVLRVKKISEPLIVGGRLRPKKNVWHAEEDDAPFRFTYFNENIDATIHARTISDLCQDGATFKDLFLPDPPEISENSGNDDDDDDDEDDQLLERPSFHLNNQRMQTGNGDTATLSRFAPRQGEPPTVKSPPASKDTTGTNTPDNRESQTATPGPEPGTRPKRYGPRPTFWLDVLKPTEMEMKVLAKAFGIHQLTTEDILMEEPREKVELFQSYYFVNYRSFEQDKDHSEYMEPVNIYVVVFREAVISFHHSMTPHPANVRRRIRQLNDYMSPTADWISYAIIDDVTDAYAPLVQVIEDEVDDIDDEILHMHRGSGDDAAASSNKAKANSDSIAAEAANQGDMGAAKTENEKTAGESGGDMLRRVGECRKKVMSLYRLLGNKADVIKGFAKRCNEHWEVAPRSEIGLYLGDIQDHIVTMTANLSHYEKYAFCPPSPRTHPQPCDALRSHPARTHPQPRDTRSEVIPLTPRPTQPPLQSPQQLPRPDQHAHERARRADGRRPRQAHRPRHHRPTHEHRHRHVGHERLGPRPDGRGQPDLVLVHHRRPGRLRPHLLLCRQEGLSHRVMLPFVSV